MNELIGLVETGNWIEVWTILRFG